jgi:hypothetical protein
VLEARSPDRRLFRTAGDAERLELQRSNKSVIEAIRRLPEETTVVHWTHPSVEGFIASRRSLWRHPEFRDAADCLVVQKAAAGASAMADAIRELVEVTGSHLVDDSTPDFVILRRKEEVPLPEPAESVGFGYLFGTRARSRPRRPGLTGTP